MVPKTPRRRHHQTTHGLPLVAQVSQAVLITRTRIIGSGSPIGEPEPVHHARRAPEAVHRLPHGVEVGPHGVAERLGRRR